jgi:co-chaperonin GroES (HSP10)
MGLQVQGHRILIKPDTVKDQIEIPQALKDSKFEVVKPVELEKREEAGTEIGTVVSVGPTAFRAFDGQDPNWRPWCKPGDRVIFTRYSGKRVEDPVTKEKFFVVNDEDIQVVVTGEADPFEGVL